MLEPVAVVAVNTYVSAMYVYVRACVYGVRVGLHVQTSTTPKYDVRIVDTYGGSHVGRVRAQE